ncbi:hypothetical protein FA10DRAFT_263470 [Acaromyces ingoldii]|uniref:Signal peptidase complex subunit 2 n=1 Tax=Acaromyces ingoldii TaxID=215250 RepID=A0A316YUD3_9BASI|nr:hypothetical protein FA10DRAFT_263470 [Acaromyces ingoldii]PWN92712.1 hypothetical protein FA10DRAFT_263470 [Acaromyces ingoldii]
MASEKKQLQDTGDLPPAEDRIYVDNSNISELKSTCDDAVERILTRSSPSASLAPASGATPTNGASSPVSASSPSSSTSSLPRAPTDSSEPFPPFKASHFHTDLRLALGYTAAVVMIGTSVWSYFVEKEWEKNKWPCAVAVVIYIVLSGVQTADAYMQGHTIFIGKRKMLAKRIETERLVIASPPLPKPVTAATPSADGKRWTTPPVYSLHVDYTRKSNGGKSLLREAKEKVELGHMGEWFTEEGEFVESIFQARLLAGLEKAFG